MNTLETQRLDWDPLSLEQVRELMPGADLPWWIGGGWALDLSIGRQTRPHEDTDIQILRPDQFVMYQVLAGWDIYRTGTHLTPWCGKAYLTLESGADSLWCRRRPGQPWNLQVMLMETEGEEWIYRRCRAIRGPLSSLGHLTDDGIPYLAPEIQLLYKGGMARRRAKDDQDFLTMLPHLSGRAKAWLKGALLTQFPAGHDWLAYLE